MRGVTSKRLWTERDWDVAMEAQSFVAVYAEVAVEEEPTKKKSGGKRKKGKKKKETEDEGEKKTKQGESESFWLAQLQDDVTEDMLEADALVRVTWLNQVTGEDGETKARYEYAYDDYIEVQTILCHVFMVEVGSNMMQITEKSLARVGRSLRRTRGEETDGEESEDEVPPRVSTNKRKRSSHATAGGGDDDDNDRPKRGRKGRRIAAPKKISKRMAAMHILPHYTTVDEDKYKDHELLGERDSIDDFGGDLLSSTREFMRAVRTSNYNLVKRFIEDEQATRLIFSVRAYQSADVKKTAMQYAIEADDIKMVSLLMKARKKCKSKLADQPEVSLPSHSTGSHTSAYSDYNRRAINASRGGREGNNALLEDCDAVGDEDEEDAFVWNCPTTSVAMVTALFPSGDWINHSASPTYIRSVAHTGSFRLASKLVEVLAKNGGWGYNDLHARVLSTKDEPLPAFRASSVMKKAQQTNITPLHLAAINPNTKYLEALWDSIASEYEEVRDNSGLEPIHYAVVNESSAAAEFLLSKNGNLLSRTKAKHTPLMQAIIARRQETAIKILDFVGSESEDLCNQVLTSKGPESRQLIHFAAANNCVQVLSHLLAMGVDVNAIAANQTTALSLASRHGHIECVKLLLSHGAKVDRHDKLKKTPLMYAVKNGHTKIAAMLINNGANVNAYDTSENSIVHYAASYGWLSCLSLLYDSGADLWSRNSWGFVPLICAMLKKRTLCVDFILKSDSEQRFLDYRDRSGCTMLWLQCKHSKDLAQVRYLLEKGLSPNIGSCDNEKPLDVLIRRAHSSSSKFFIEAIKALVQYGAVVNYSRTVEEEEQGIRLPEQPLQIAIRNNLKSIFDFLLAEAGADPYLQESDGTDAWLTSASMGETGSYYLEQLMKRFPTPFDMSAKSYGSNIFHCIAKNASARLTHEDVVEKLARHCTNVVELMHENDSHGMSPLMVLYDNERPTFDRSDKFEHSDIVTMDTRFCKIARIYLGYIEKTEALRRFVSVKSYIDKEKGEEEDNVVYESVHDSTIFHIATRRKSQMGSDPSWFGDQLVRLVLECYPASKTLVDIQARGSHETPLLTAVKKNDTVTVQVLLENGVDPDYSPARCSVCRGTEKPCSECSRGELRDTALIRASRRERHDLVQMLLKHGASTDCIDSSSRNTPLHLAVEIDDAKLIKMLLRKGSSSTKTNETMHTPLLSAILGGKSVQSRKTHEGEINFTDVMLGRDVPPAAVNLIAHEPTAAASDSVIDLLLEASCAPKAIRIADQYGRTPLHYAAANRDLFLVQALLRHVGLKGEYVNARDAFGRTALHFALNAVSMQPDASFDIERFLLLSGAEVNAVDDFGLTAIHYAFGKISMDWHTDYDADLGDDRKKKQQAEGTYEKHKAAAFTQHLHCVYHNQADPVETVSNLLAAGCDPLARDSLGRSPMHLAASIGAFVCASTLLSSCQTDSRGDLLECQDIDGFTPLGRAFQHARETAITTLIQSGASVSSTLTINGEARTFFSIAVEKNMSGICHMLLNAGFSRRQAVEDAVCGNQLQLAKNLMVGLEISSERGQLLEANKKGETLLHCLAKTCPEFDDLAADFAWALVDDGLSATVKDEDGNSPLHHAAGQANIRLMDFLTHHGTRINDINSAGDTPLMYGLKTRSKSSGIDDKAFLMLQYFFSRADLDICIRDREGSDSLSLFVEYFLEAFTEDDIMMKWLETALTLRRDLNHCYPVISGGDLFLIDKLGSSKGAHMPLLVRVSYSKSRRGRLRLLSLLLENGASPSVIDSNGNSLLMHLAARNMNIELAHVIRHAASKDVSHFINVVNRQGFTALHIAIEPFTYGSHENTNLVKLLIDSGASLDKLDKRGESPLDCTQRQASRVLFRFIKTEYPTLVQQSEDDAMEDDDFIHSPPDFEQDARVFLTQCEARGKIKRETRAPTVSEECDVGAVSSVYGLVGADGKLVQGEEYDAVLTKVDVKNGRFGVNVFYKTQVVHDELQDIYVVFTNWGRIGETGKYQNTPFHSATEAIAEFKKIFKSKTGNAWEDRKQFEKKVGKYNLVQCANHTTKIDEEVTRSFAVHANLCKEQRRLKKPKHPILADFASPRRSELGEKPVMDTLFAITDVRYLQLAARERCNYRDDLPLARDEDLKRAMKLLAEIRSLVVDRCDINNEITRVTGNLTEDDSTSALGELSENFAQLTEQLSERSSRYYEIVPCNESERGGAIRAFDDASEVDSEMYRLRRLLEITRTYKMLLGAKLRLTEVHPMEYLYNSLQIKLDRVQPNDTSEHAMLTTYFFNGIRPKYRSQYRISNIFQITRKGEAQRFEKCLESDIAFRQQHTSLLWHGTRRTNLMGILSEGLRIAPPEAPHNGYAYGKGIYFSDVSVKSLSYCDSPYRIEDEGPDPKTGKLMMKTRRVQYMLLCEVALGNQRDVYSSYSFDRDTIVSDRVHSVRAIGRHMPNNEASLVSPMCGAMIPMGMVGRPGYDYPIPSAWAIRGTEQRDYDSYAFGTWSIEAASFLDDKLNSVTPLAVGTSFVVECENLRKSLVSKGWYSIDDGDKVEMRIAMIHNITESFSAYDIALEIVVTPASTKNDGDNDVDSDGDSDGAGDGACDNDDGGEGKDSGEEGDRDDNEGDGDENDDDDDDNDDENGDEDDEGGNDSDNDGHDGNANECNKNPVVVATARRYQEVLFNKPPKLDKGFSFAETYYAAEYNEHIVYKTEQARLRYLVEVELL